MPKLEKLTLISKKMKKILLFALVALMCMPALAKKQDTKKMEQFRYEIECAGNGTKGVYLVKASCYTKKINLTDARLQCMKNAVHGVIFKGFSGNGCVSQSPLARQAGAEYEYAEYFKLFFADNGEYLKYATITSEVPEIVQVGKEKRVSYVVTIQKDQLRKALEAAGVIKSLAGGF